MYSKKIIFFIILLSITLIYSIYYIYYPFASLQSATQQKERLNSNKQEIIILWDLHQVVFHHSIIHWAYLFFTQGQFFSIIRNLNWPTIKIFFQFILRKLKLYPIEITNEEFLTIAKAAGNSALVDLVILISCDYYPDPAVVDLIKKLRRHYPQHVGSNIGATVFAQFYKKYPDIFSLFDYYQTVCTDILPVAKKPNSLFFTSYLTIQNKKANSSIFIDDRIANVSTAQQEGMIGILFKNADQLQQDLIELGIL